MHLICSSCSKWNKSVWNNILTFFNVRTSQTFTGRMRADQLQSFITNDITAFWKFLIKTIAHRLWCHSSAFNASHLQGPLPSWWQVAWPAWRAGRSPRPWTSWKRGSKCLAPGAGDTAGSSTASEWAWGRKESECFSKASCWTAWGPSPSTPSPSSATRAWWRSSVHRERAQLRTVHEAKKSLEGNN